MTFKARVTSKDPYQIKQILKEGQLILKKILEENTGAINQIVERWGVAYKGIESPVHDIDPQFSTSLIQDICFEFASYHFIIAFDVVTSNQGLRSNGVGLSLDEFAIEISQTL